MDPEKKVQTLFSLPNMESPKVQKVCHWLSKKHKSLQSFLNFRFHPPTTSSALMPDAWIFNEARADDDIFVAWRNSRSGQTQKPTTLYFDLSLDIQILQIPGE